MRVQIPVPFSNATPLLLLPIPPTNQNPFASPAMRLICAQAFFCPQVSFAQMRVLIPGSFNIVAPAFVFANHLLESEPARITRDAIRFAPQDSLMKIKLCANKGGLSPEKLIAPTNTKQEGSRLPAFFISGFIRKRIPDQQRSLAINPLSFCEAW